VETKQKNMTKKITEHLKRNNSYFKWSAKRLADKFGCSERTITNIIKTLAPVKRTYLNNLK